MVTSCRKYFDHALRMQAALRARGAFACIVIGDPTQRVATWDGDVCTLPVADNYEGLPLKVAAGVNALMQRFGAVAVVKIDDDCQLTANFTARALPAAGRASTTTSAAARNPHLCRFWHFGKTQQADGPVLAPLPRRVGRRRLLPARPARGGAGGPRVRAVTRPRSATSTTRTRPSATSCAARASR